MQSRERKEAAAGTILSSTVAYIFEMGDETKFTSIPASQLQVVPGRPPETVP